jgi:preprotein translocase SecE subunit
MAKSYDNNTETPRPGPKKAAPAKPAPAAGGPGPGRLSDAQRRAQQMANKPPVSPTQFFQEAWVELKKTTWPNRDILTKSTSVVLALVATVAIWVGGLNYILDIITAKVFLGR